MEGVRPPQPETHAQAFERVVGKAVYNILTMTAIGDDTNQLYLEAAADMAVLHDEFGRRFSGSLDMIAHDRVARLRDSSTVELAGAPPLFTP